MLGQAELLLLHILQDVILRIQCSFELYRTYIQYSREGIFFARKKRVGGVISDNGTGEKNYDKVS